MAENYKREENPYSKQVILALVSWIAGVSCAYHFLLSVVVSHVRNSFILLLVSSAEFA
jgi:hypothetical protein